jgi:hypothetical protein
MTSLVDEYRGSVTAAKGVHVRQQDSWMIVHRRYRTEVQ